MAYLDTREGFAGAAPVFASSIPAVFERQEWEIIVLARHDGLASLQEPGRLARAMAWLFGGTIDRRLASPRLEALRRLAVLAWHHGYQAPVSAMKAFKAEGFSADQLELLLASVATSRSQLASR
ncbi:hypothetical protein [Sphingomonas abietis]|uniref:Uncharacterized protein n=1 Tax=Sphingomonas abietis TaxID=3012344 RepID=A0ABY7NPG3_9SPHN|nr:hypothetical protein [Sphingomonas abietis]WBO23434.1 hypothetical protein PBT88_04705 [Sphingomonas abietis]